MSSAEELFKLTDAEKAKKAVRENRVSNPLVNGLSKINREPSLAATNIKPGLVVKSSYKIDTNKGFYMVKHDGISALIGKIQDEVFVLKKFGKKSVDDKIQVRKDKENVYMVKTKDFKSLVEVDETKMGVLVEL
jgi:hypothetical protein